MPGEPRLERSLNLRGAVALNMLDMIGVGPFITLPLILVAMGVVIYGIVYWSQPVLVLLASIYVGSGIAIRLGGILRRYFRPTPKPNPETQVG